MGSATHTLYVGDSLDVLKTLPDESVHCCVTSPPYGRIINYAAASYPTGRGQRPNMRARGDLGNNGGIAPEQYANWLLPIIAEIARVLVRGGVFVLNLNGQGAFTYPEQVVVRTPRETDLVLHERVCWVKANAIPVGHRGSHLIPEWEPIWVFRRGAQLAYFGRDDIRRPYSLATIKRAQRGNLHRGQRGHHIGQAHPYVRGEKPEYTHPSGRDAANVIYAAPEQRPQWPHPARFPEAIPAFFIAAYCPEGGTVLDPFGGSGTTSDVAKRLGRSSIYIDLNLEYAKIAERRCFEQREILEDYAYRVIDMRAKEVAP